MILQTDNFLVGDTVEIVWNEGDDALECEVIKIERGFVVYEEKSTRQTGVFRPSSPFMIKIQAREK